RARAPGRSSLPHRVRFFAASDSNLRATEASTSRSITYEASSAEDRAELFQIGTVPCFNPEQRGPRESAMKTGSILIVDDDADVLLTAELVLKKEFRRVATESDPRRLAAALRNEPFDVVLLDINFSPGQTTGQEGVECLRTVERM